MIEAPAFPTTSTPATRPDTAHRDRADLDAGVCPICGMPALVERRCKVVCRHCLTILQSCADL